VGHPDNPLGTGVDGDEAAPISYPDDAERTACFAPTSQIWPTRREKLPPEVRSHVADAMLEIPEGFDWSFFQAAPRDQQLRYLDGDEWIVLEGMHPELQSIRTRLPTVKAFARVHEKGRPSDRLGELNADLLVIDAERQTCSLTWRGNFTVANEEALTDLDVAAGIAVGGERMAWPPYSNRDVRDHPAGAAPTSSPDSTGRRARLVASGPHGATAAEALGATMSAAVSEVMPSAGRRSAAAVVANTGEVHVATEELDRSTPRAQARTLLSLLAAEPSELVWYAEQLCAGESHLTARDLQRMREILEQLARATEHCDAETIARIEVAWRALAEAAPEARTG
jgi:hypothetical protein